MKRIGLTVLAAALFIAAALSFSLPAVSADGELDAILANMQKTAQTIRSIRAGLEQEKRDKQIGGREYYRGQVFFKHAGKGSDKVRIEYSNGQVVTVNGNEITLYQPAIKQVIITTRQATASQNQEFSFIATPYSSVPELKSRYNIAHKGDDRVGSTPTAILELTPKGRSAAQKLTLWVSRSEWIPIKYQVIERNGDLTTFTLSNVVRNAAMSDGLFKIKWPGDTKVIRK